MKDLASACVAVLALAGCSGDREPSATVKEIVPSAAYNDTSVAVAIQGGPFRPSYTIDLGGGAAAIQQGAFVASLVPWAEGEAPEPFAGLAWKNAGLPRSEEHTSELQSHSD